MKIDKIIKTWRENDFCSIHDLLTIIDDDKITIDDLYDIFNKLSVKKQRKKVKKEENKKDIKYINVHFGPIELLLSN